MPTFAVEGVAGFVEVDRCVGIRVFDFLDIRQRYAAVFFSEMEDQRCEWLLIEKLNDLATVVTDGGIDFQARGAQPCIGEKLVRAVDYRD